MNTSPVVTVNVHKDELFGPGWQSFVFLLLHRFTTTWGLQQSIEEFIFYNQ